MIVEDLESSNNSAFTIGLPMMLMTRRSVYFGVLLFCCILIILSENWIFFVRAYVITADSRPRFFIIDAVLKTKDSSYSNNNNSVQ